MLLVSDSERCAVVYENDLAMEMFYEKWFETKKIWKRHKSFLPESHYIAMLIFAALQSGVS